jgi:hypothetical protein
VKTPAGSFYAEVIDGLAGVGVAVALIVVCHQPMPQ